MDVHRSCSCFVLTVCFLLGQLPLTLHSRVYLIKASQWKRVLFTAFGESSHCELLKTLTRLQRVWSCYSTSEPLCGAMYDGLVQHMIRNKLFLKGNSGIFKPRPYFWHEIRSSTHREQFGESLRPSEDI